MAGFLIKDTTREEREQIVADSLVKIDKKAFPDSKFRQQDNQT